ncbi:ATP-dependent protease [Rhodococcus rhodnii]|uniref:ATP-dependent protease n=1 Tax=Rhodococcus rhodnii TaxID=38312 RepID=A0A6P2CJH7_9NOCA|nr:LON peptidase substrate-binding domain-containing protein [Rhodococcus rhodnii]TXG92472.1 ATP-dependent protease [Rhodococcus rhodnii]
MERLPMFPLGSCFLPGQRLPLHIFEPRYARLVEDALDENPAEPTFGVVLIARGSEVGGGDERYDVGTLARIEAHVRAGDGRYELFCRTRSRIRVLEWLPDDPYPVARAEVWDDENTGTALASYEWTGLVERLDHLYGLLGRLADLTGSDVPAAPELSRFTGGLGERLYEIASYVPMGDADRQGILAAPGADERMRAVAETIENAVDMVQFRLS